MYKRILLATDGTPEGLTALREGALLAAEHGAEGFLLVIDRDSPGKRVASGVYPIQDRPDHAVLLEFGLKRLRRLGVVACGKAVAGEPGELIGAFAGRFQADLVVVGHRRQSAVERWWSGPSGAYLVENVNCSVLIARSMIADEEFEAHMDAEREPVDT